MPTPPLSQEVIDQTLAALEKHGGSRTEAAKELGIPSTTLGSRLSRMREAGLTVPAPSPASVKRPNRPKKSAADKLAVSKKAVEENALLKTIREKDKAIERLQAQVEAARAAGRKVAPISPKPPRIGKEDYMRVIFPDLHGTFQEETAVAAFLSDLRKLQPDYGLGLGDITDCGGFLAQHHVWGYVAESTYSFEDDIRATNLFLDGCQNASPMTDWELLEGNHERRIETWCMTQAQRGGTKDASFLFGKVGPKVLLELDRRGIRYYPQSGYYDGLTLNGAIKRGKCLFVHDAVASKIHRYGVNVVHGHDHHLRFRGIHSVGSGDIGMWSAGCLSKRQPLWRHTDPTEWMHGYIIQVMSKSGNFLNFTVPIINGQSLLPDISLR